jgi:hypothetical protein
VHGLDFVDRFERRPVLRSLSSSTPLALTRRRQRQATQTRPLDPFERTATLELGPRVVDPSNPLATPVSLARSLDRLDVCDCALAVLTRTDKQVRQTELPLREVEVRDR